MAKKTKYEPTPMEHDLLSKTIDISELEMIDDTNECHIQIVSFKGIKTLKSIEDNFRKIRIVLVALLVKIYVVYHESNADRLNRIKSMVYSSKLESITEQKGIEKEQLLKSFAENITSLEVSSEAEKNIIKLFNCKPFFDLIILSSIHEQNPLLLENDCELVSWLNREFAIKVLMNEEPLLEEEENELCLIGLGEEFHASKDCRSSECNFKGFKDYLRFSSESFAGDSDVSEIYGKRSNGRLFDSSLSPSLKNSHYQKDSSRNLYLSIDSVSPSLHEQGKEVSKDQRSPEKFNVGLFDSVTFHKSKAPSEIYSPEPKVIKVRRIEHEEEGSSIWNILCCSLGRS